MTPSIVTTYSTNNRIEVIDPMDVIMTNINEQIRLWKKDSDPNRIDSILKMELRVLKLEKSFRENLN
jgi:hypothetical protein